MLTNTNGSERESRRLKCRVHISNLEETGKGLAKLSISHQV